MGWLILLLFSVLGTIGGVMTFSATLDGRFLNLFIVCTVLDIVFIVLYRNSKYYYRKKQEEDKQKERAVKTLSAAHQAGLPLAVGAACTIIKENGKFLILAGGNEFSLKKEKITDICVKTDVEIQTQYVSSAGGAVAGGMLFGPLGAMVGGRAKQKNTSTVEYYLIFTYRSNSNEICYASFRICADLKSLGIKKAREWEKEFKTNNSGRTGIVEL